MFRILIFSLLIAGCIGNIACFTGCSKKEKKAEAPAKVAPPKKDDLDLSSKEATYRNFMTALNNNDLDKAWKCIPPQTQKKGIAIAKEEKKSLDEFKRESLGSLRENLQEILKSQYNNDLEKFIKDSFTKCSDSDFVYVDGKWYIEL